MLAVAGDMRVSAHDDWYQSLRVSSLSRFIIGNYVK